jgi:hypothetical protein
MWEDFEEKLKEIFERNWGRFLRKNVGNFNSFLGRSLLTVFHYLFFVIIKNLLCRKCKIFHFFQFFLNVFKFPLISKIYLAINTAKSSNLNNPEQYGRNLRANVSFPSCVPALKLSIFGAFPSYLQLMHVFVLNL